MQACSVVVRSRLALWLGLALWLWLFGHDEAGRRSDFTLQNIMDNKYNLVLLSLCLHVLVFALSAGTAESVHSVAVTRFAKAFGDHMVLQHHEPCIWYVKCSLSLYFQLSRLYRRKIRLS